MSNVRLHMTRIKSRRLQKGNPHQITIRQHVLPRRSIARFVGKGAKVEVRRFNVAGIIRLSADNEMFCANRAWDQRAETGYSRPIEIAFQRLADSLLAGKIALDEGDHLTVLRFWALWRLRAEARVNPISPAKLRGVHEAREFSLPEQEVLESKHVAYVENGNEIPSHILTGLRIQVQIDRLTATPILWGLIHSPDCEFIVPDTVGTIGFVPLSPSCALLAKHTDRIVAVEESRQINQALREAATDYVFAKNLSRALGSGAT